MSLAAKRNRFSSKQVGALVDAITFEAGKVSVVKFTARKIVDPNRSHTILAHFTFSDGKEQARRLLDN